MINSLIIPSKFWKLFLTPTVYKLLIEISSQKTFFGIAKHFSCCNKSDEKCGSLKYFSPEMFQSGEICPFKADILALGVTFSCMATGYYPFKVANRRDDLQKDILSCNFEGIVHN